MPASLTLIDTYPHHRPKVVLIGPDNTSDDTDDDDPGKDCLSKRRNVYLTQFMLLIFAALIIGQGH